MHAGRCKLTLLVRNFIRSIDVGEQDLAVGPLFSCNFVLAQALPVATAGVAAVHCFLYSLFSDIPFPLLDPSLLTDSLASSSVLP